MKNRIVKLPLSTYFLISTLSLTAAVPLRWTVETSRLQPAVFDVVRGEMIDLEATFQSYGKPLSMTNHPCCIFWQTNGMDNAWWKSAASATSNRVTAAFTPQMDPGGATVNGFIGSTGQIYRAAFTLRFRHGPGADPNVIDQPPRILDLAHTVVVNPPWPTQADFAATTTVMRADLTTLAGTVATVSAKADQANLYSSGVYQYMIGNTNAWFAETNYVTNAEITNRTHFAWEDGMNAGTVPGSLALWEIRDGQRKRVWDQRDWTAWYWSFKAAQLSNNMVRVIGAVADEVGTNCMKRGWAKYTAVRGLDNPDPSALVVDTQKVQLFAGHQWEKLVETGGAGYWTLTGNGIELSAADTTNTFLTVKDFEGNACLTFRKTSSYLVYCECGTDITSNYMDGQGRVVFHITTDVQPTAEFSTTLDLDDFVEQGESGCPANYEWTGSSGNWDCHFMLKPGIVSNACFARFKVMRQGENVVEHTIPIKINGGIIFDHNGQSVKIRPTVTSTEVGSTVNWVVAQ